MGLLRRKPKHTHRWQATAQVEGSEEEGHFKVTPLLPWFCECGEWRRENRVDPGESINCTIDGIVLGDDWETYPEYRPYEEGDS